VPAFLAAVRRFAVTARKSWKAAGLWDRIQKSARVAEFTFQEILCALTTATAGNGTRG